MVVLACVAVALLFALVSRDRSRFYRWAAGVALGAHLAFSLFVLPRLPYRWDIGRFHDVATGILNGADTGALSSLDAFGTVQALVYAVFGTDPTALAVSNGLLAVVTPLPACYLATRLYGTLESTDGLLLTLLYLPFPFLFGSLPMRDALSTLLALTLLALCVRALVDGRYEWALATPPLWGMLLLLREELAFLILLGAAGAVLVATRTRIADQGVTVTTLALASVPVGIGGVALFVRFFPVDALNARLQYRSTGGAAYLDFAQYDSWVDVILAAPVRAIYFQFAPFPLHVDSAFDLVAVLSLPLVIVLATAAYIALRSHEPNPVVAALLLLTYVGGVLGYGLVDSNFGTTLRHRSLFVFLLAVFGAPVLEPWFRSVRARVRETRRQPRETDEQQRKAEELDPGA